MTMATAAAPRAETAADNGEQRDFLLAEVQAVAHEKEVECL
eukprot:CAMPEP_0182890742 /NCGR_PEP_ID=MMETSP0034_2-20130328/22846_1 /TAXON_ID=156128 /ORGANISM="Nephroselmis pyriformis, Strain CCMP717" /LENGTH=40 /DNA_ID= /DNA_START= /DNA_END= /DNA_ORIENTATION=